MDSRGVVIMHSTHNFNMWGAGYDYTTYSKNFLLARFISIYYTAIAPKIYKGSSEKYKGKISK